MGGGYSRGLLGLVWHGKSQIQRYGNFEIKKPKIVSGSSLAFVGSG
jgi:hypothetical protein